MRGGAIIIPISLALGGAAVAIIKSINMDSPSEKGENGRTWKGKEMNHSCDFHRKREFIATLTSSGTEKTQEEVEEKGASPSAPHVDGHKFTFSCMNEQHTEQQRPGEEAEEERRTHRRHNLCHKNNKVQIIAKHFITKRNNWLPGLCEMNYRFRDCAIY